MIDLTEALAGDGGAFELAIQLLGENAIISRVVATDAFGHVVARKERDVRVAAISMNSASKSAISCAGDLGAYATRERASFILAARYLIAKPRPEEDLLRVGGVDYRIATVETRRSNGRVVAYVVECVRE